MGPLRVPITDDNTRIECSAFAPIGQLLLLKLKRISTDCVPKTVTHLDKDAEGPRHF